MWDQVGQALSQSMNRMLDQMASLLPGVFALIAALLVSALAAWILAAILRRSLTGFDFDRRVAQWGLPALAEWSPDKSPTLLASRTIAWTVMLIGFLIGISAFDVALTSQFVIRLFAYLPNVLAAVVVLAAGSIVARFLARSVLIGAVNMNLQYARASERRREMAGDRSSRGHGPRASRASEAALSVWHSAFYLAGLCWHWLWPWVSGPRNSSAGLSTARPANRPTRTYGSQSDTCRRQCAEGDRGAASHNYKCRSPILRRQSFFGKVKQNVAPLPSSDSTQMRPSWRLTIFRQIARPMPLPELLSRG